LAVKQFGPDEEARQLGLFASLSASPQRLGESLHRRFISARFVGWQRTLMSVFLVQQSSNLDGEVATTGARCRAV
jgi:hypothetical protein